MGLLASLLVLQAPPCADGLQLRDAPTRWYPDGTPSGMDGPRWVTDKDGKTVYVAPHVSTKDLGTGHSSSGINGPKGPTLPAGGACAYIAGAYEDNWHQTLTVSQYDCDVSFMYKGVQLNGTMIKLVLVVHDSNWSPGMVGSSGDIYFDDGGFWLKQKQPQAATNTSVTWAPGTWAPGTQAPEVAVTVAPGGVANGTVTVFPPLPVLTTSQPTTSYSIAGVTTIPPAVESPPAPPSTTPSYTPPSCANVSGIYTDNWDEVFKVKQDGCKVTFSYQGRTKTGVVGMKTVQIEGWSTATMSDDGGIYFADGGHWIKEQVQGSSSTSVPSVPVIGSNTTTPALPVVANSTAASTTLVASTPPITTAGGFVPTTGGPNPVSTTASPEPPCANLSGTYTDNWGETFTVIQEKCDVYFDYKGVSMTGKVNVAKLSVQGWQPGLQGDDGDVRFSDGGHWYKTKVEPPANTTRPASMTTSLPASPPTPPLAPASNSTSSSNAPGTTPLPLATTTSSSSSAEFVCANLSGIYTDNWGKVIKVTQDQCRVSFDYGGKLKTGVLNDHKLSIDGWSSATVGTDGDVYFADGGHWTKEQVEAPVKTTRPASTTLPPIVPTTTAGVPNTTSAAVAVTTSLPASPPTPPLAPASNSTSSSNAPGTTPLPLATSTSSSSSSAQPLCANVSGIYTDNWGKEIKVTQDQCSVSFGYGGKLKTGVLNDHKLSIEGWSSATVGTDGDVYFADGGHWTKKQVEPASGSTTSTPQTSASAQATSKAMTTLPASTKTSTPALPTSKAMTTLPASTTLPPIAPTTLSTTAPPTLPATTSPPSPSITIVPLPKTTSATPAPPATTPASTTTPTVPPTTPTVPPTTTTVPPTTTTAPPTTTTVLPTTTTVPPTTTTVPPTTTTVPPTTTTVPPTTTTVPPTTTTVPPTTTTVPPTTTTVPPTTTTVPPTTTTVPPTTTTVPPTTTTVPPTTTTVPPTTTTVPPTTTTAPATTTAAAPTTTAAAPTTSAAVAVTTSLPASPPTPPAPASSSTSSNAPGTTPLPLATTISSTTTLCANVSGIYTDNWGKVITMHQEQCIVSFNYGGEMKTGVLNDNQLSIEGWSSATVGTYGDIDFADGGHWTREQAIIETAVTLIPGPPSTSVAASGTTTGSEVADAVPAPAPPAATERDSLEPATSRAANGKRSRHQRQSLSARE